MKDKVTSTNTTVRQRLLTYLGSRKTAIGMEGIVERITAKADINSDTIAREVRRLCTEGVVINTVAVRGKKGQYLLTR